MRSTVLRALLVCSVPKTSRPVSAAVSASEIVSRSRISPTSTMSASSRKAAFSPTGKARGVLGHLALGDDAFLVLMHELDGFLNRDDVAGEIRVDVVDERGQRRALARAGRPRDEHQPGAQVAELLDDRPAP